MLPQQASSLGPRVVRKEDGAAAGEPRRRAPPAVTVAERKRL